MTTTAEPQYMRALARANSLRLEGVRIRREVSEMPRREAMRRVADLLEDPPEAIQRTRVDFLLRSIPRFGVGTVRGMLGHAQCSGFRCVGPDSHDTKRPLTERQRRALAADLRKRAG